MVCALCMQTYQEGRLVGNMQLPAGDMEALLRPPAVPSRRRLGSMGNLGGAKRMGIDKLGQVGQACVCACACVCVCVERER
jgi:hypothetical protein